MWFRRKKTETPAVEEVPFCFSPTGLDPLLAHVLLQCGVDLRGKRDVLETRIRFFCERKRIGSFDALLVAVRGDSVLWQELLNLLTVNETFFLREHRQLENAVAFASRQQRPVRVLCAPCASGEEVYSLALLFAEAGFPASDVSITGIDINSDAIEEARNARYSARSVHKVSADSLERYFQPDEKGYRVRTERLCSVTFRVVNLFHDDFDRIGTYDIVFCRNMLIYFDDVHRLEAARQLRKRLREGGRLYVGHADLLPEAIPFRKEYEEAVAYYATL